MNVWCVCVMVWWVLRSSSHHIYFRFTKPLLGNILQSFFPGIAILFLFWKEKQEKSMISNDTANTQFCHLQYLHIFLLIKRHNLFWEINISPREVNRSSKNWQISQILGVTRSLSWTIVWYADLILPCSFMELSWPESISCKIICPSLI